MSGQCEGVRRCLIGSVWLATMERDPLEGRPLAYITRRYYWAWIELAATRPWRILLQLGAAVILATFFAVLEVWWVGTVVGVAVMAVMLGDVVERHDRNPKS